jgi:hypothetical protein
MFLLPRSQTGLRRKHHVIHNQLKRLRLEQRINSSTGSGLSLAMKKITA